MKRTFFFRLLVVFSLFQSTQLFAINVDSFSFIKRILKSKLPKPVINKLDFKTSLLFTSPKIDAVTQTDTMITVPEKGSKSMSRFLLVDYQDGNIRKAVWVSLYESEHLLKDKKITRIEISTLNKNIKKTYIVNTKGEVTSIQYVDSSGNKKITNLTEKKFKENHYGYSIPNITSGFYHEDTLYHIGMLNTEWLLDTSPSFPFYNGGSATYINRFLCFIPKHFGLLEVEMDNSINLSPVNLW